jgi:hypothetical protein
MNDSDDKFNLALERYLQTGEVNAELLAHKQALRTLQTLKQVPDRDPGRANAMRQDFLEEVASGSQAVSRGRKERLNGWISFFRKENSPMFAIARIIAIAAILLGGTAGTAFASRESLPDQALYPVKTLIEDVRLGLTNDPQAEFDLLMTFIEQRFTEIQAMVQNGEPVGEQVQQRMQNQLQSAFQSAAELDDPALLKAMERVREQSRKQLQILSQLHQGDDAGGNLDLAEQAVIRSQIQAEGALEDPNTLRIRYGAERNEDAPDQPEIMPPGNGEGAGGSESPGPAGPGEGNLNPSGGRGKGRSE